MCHGPPVTSEDYDDTPDTEDIFNQLSRMLGVPAPTGRKRSDKPHDSNAVRSRQRREKKALKLLAMHQLIVAQTHVSVPILWVALACQLGAWWRCVLSADRRSDACILTTYDDGMLRFFEVGIFFFVEVFTLLLKFTMFLEQSFFLAVYISLTIVFLLVCLVLTSDK